MSEKKLYSRLNFTKTEAICSHQGFIDNDNPNRSNNIEQPCSCIDCSLLVTLSYSHRPILSKESPTRDLLTLEHNIEISPLPHSKVSFVFSLFNPHPFRHLNFMKSLNKENFNRVIHILNKNANSFGWRIKETLSKGYLTHGNLINHNSFH